MNLAKTEKQRGGALPQRTFRRETTMPRQGTDLPNREVNARIIRPNDNGAEDLQKILGLVGDIGAQGVKTWADNRAKKDDASGAFDAASGKKDERLFRKSTEYREGFQREGAKNLAIGISAEVQEAVTARLNDEDNPATVEDIDELIEGIYGKHLKDERGNPLDFGTVQAKTILGNALSEIKATTMPQALKVIRDQEHNKFLNTLVQNQIYETLRGSPVGAVVDVKATPEDDEEAPKATPAAASAVSLGAATGRPPHTGAVTSSFAAHSKRGSAGVDIDGRMNDPIEAPSGGTVTVGKDSRSGNFVRIDHGNGVVSSYSHLASTSLKTGDVIKPGQTLGLMGNTGNVSKGSGDGSHLHYRVKVGGRDVDPMSYSFKGGGTGTPMSDGADVEFASAPKPNADYYAPKVDFEAILSAVPSSIGKGKAKKFILQALVNEANMKGDPSLLNGLEDSVKADGSPSFTPDEIATVLSSRDAISERSRIRADRAEKEVHEANADQLLEAMMSDNPPSDDFIRRAAVNGQLDDGFAFSILRTREAERKAEAREVKAEARQDRLEAESDINAWVASKAIQFETGETEGGSTAELQQLFESGKLGSGNKALQRFASLRAAASRGDKLIESEPEYARYVAVIKQQYAPVRTSGGLMVSAGPGKDLVTYSTILAGYRANVKKGEDPAAAYFHAVAQFGPKGGAETAGAKQQRINYLKSKQAGRLQGGR